MARQPKIKKAADELLMRINKRFFVDMLTRDIELEDAILDLVDNCLDGIIRSSGKSLNTSKAFKSYWCKITLSEAHFVIEDNCGGIPQALIERAFGIGRNVDPTEHYKTIGIYGIGMKRAIFKMALEAIVQSHGDFGFEVSIDENWLRDEHEWRLQYRRKTVPVINGTVITVKKLRPEIAKIFSTDAFRLKLYNFISKHYSVILNKGFRVILNGTAVEAAQIALLSTSEDKLKSEVPSLAPYMFRYATASVTAALWVGMYRSPPSSEREEELETEQRQSRDNSGWTILCNDRAVVSNDTTILTGWGEAGVPRFHPQFIGIRGILSLESEYPLELPLTTTKRGLDASSPLYLHLKEYMREGTKLFTNFTNHWKADRVYAKKLVDEATLTELPELKRVMSKITFNEVRKLQGAERFSPTLPKPEPSEMKRVSFLRHQTDIAFVANKLLDDPRAGPADVGAACFDDVIGRLRRTARR